MSESTPTPSSDFESAPVSPRPALRARFKRLLLAGLLVLIPVTLTGLILYQLFELIDGIFEPFVVRLVGFRVPGIGILLTLLVILILGWLSTNVLGRQLIHLAERIVARVPIGSSVYSASKSVLEVLSHRQADAFKRVVLVEYPRRGMFSVAFVTSRVYWPQLHPDLKDARAVFLPTSPNPTSGYLLVVPLEDIIDLPITVEEGIRLVLSGGMLLPTSAGLGEQIPPSGK